MSGKIWNAVWILINSQNSNRYRRWEWYIFKINICSLSRMTVSPYRSFSEVQNPHTACPPIKASQDRAHHSCSQFRTLLRKHHYKQLPLAQQILPSSPLHTPNTEMNWRILPTELDIMFSAFSVFSGSFPTQLTHQVDILARGRKTNQADLSTVSRAGNRYP